MKLCQQDPASLNSMFHARALAMETTVKSCAPCFYASSPLTISPRNHGRFVGPRSGDENQSIDIPSAFFLEGGPRKK